MNLKIPLIPLLLLPAAGAESAGRNMSPPQPGLGTDGRPQKTSTFSLGLQALQDRDYRGALEQFEKAAAGFCIEVTPIGWLTAQYHACHALNLLDRRAEAIARARAMVSACESTLGSEDPATSEALAHLGSLLKHDGRFDEAEPVYARNLAVLVDKHGADSLFAAQARTRLADLLMLQARRSEAESHHRQALAAAQATLGQEHVETCFFLTHLAYCLHVNQKKSEATELMNMAFSILSRSHAEDLSSLCSILRRQAEFFRDVRQLDKARQAGRLCLAWLAAQNEACRCRYYYYTRVRALYHSILVADGLTPREIQMHLAEVEKPGAGTR